LPKAAVTRFCRISRSCPFVEPLSIAVAALFSRITYSRLGTPWAQLLDSPAVLRLLLNISSPPVYPGWWVFLLRASATNSSVQRDPTADTVGSLCLCVQKHQLLVCFCSRTLPSTIYFRSWNLLASTTDQLTVIIHSSSLHIDVASCWRMPVD
jgi:hypothetical protein